MGTTQGHSHPQQATENTTGPVGDPDVSARHAPEGTSRLPATAGRTLIVVPCYNEEHRLNTLAFQEFLATCKGIGLCFVDDGSRDLTARVLNSIRDAAPHAAEVVVLPNNVGKAEAVRRGVAHCLEREEASHVGFWDADLATPLNEIPRFLREFELRPELQLVCGSRVLRMGADISRSPLRHYTGRFFATAASVTLRLPFYDTQCGAKILTSGLAARVFGQPFLSPWLFDVELIARIVALEGREEAQQVILEVPLSTWVDPGGSKVGIFDFARAPLQLVRIYSKYRKSLSRTTSLAGR